jgi:hypothetical protein
MSDETTEQTTDTAKPVDISIEQICAAIINKFGSVELPIEALFTNYGEKSIAVYQNHEEKTVTFKLADNSELPMVEVTENNETIIEESEQKTE